MEQRDASIYVVTSTFSLLMGYNQYYETIFPSNRGFNSFD